MRFDVKVRRPGNEVVYHKNRRYDEANKMQKRMFKDGKVRDFPAPTHLENSYLLVHLPLKVFLCFHRTWQRCEGKSALGSRMFSRPIKPRSGCLLFVGWIFAFLIFIYLLSRIKIFRLIIYIIHAFYFYKQRYFSFEARCCLIFWDFQAHLLLSCCFKQPVIIFFLTVTETYKH